MTSRKGHPFATRQLGTLLSCRQMGTVLATPLANPAGKTADRQRLPPMASHLSLSPMNTFGHLSLSPMSRWLGVGLGVGEGEAYGGDGHGKECRDA